MSMDASDAKLAERLQRDDPEQFHTLVRMHLSFVLDLNTDESDSVTEKVKSRALKWRFVPAPFTKKVKGTAKGVMEGAPLTQEGICQVYQLIEYLSKEENICQEGIFRRTGKLTRQHELKSLLNSGVSLELSKSQFSVHDCASVLKSFLAELPEPLLTDAHYPAYCQIAEMCDNPSNKAKLLRAIQLLLLLLPSENSILLKDVLQLLHLTASFESSNKMSADNLSTLFTPHLLCPRKLSPEAFHVNSQTMSGVVAFMIRQGTDLFSIPPNLATDIRAYWSEKERRLLSPQKELDESISDGAAAAATVYTFVDRETTAKAYAINPTEAALAELYAHVQSLPESSNKRKLIKKYNKENGQGTPLQMQKSNQRGKSLGDSIKKHIFNKNLRRGKNSVEETQVECLSLEKYNNPENLIPNEKCVENETLAGASNNWNCMQKRCDVKNPVGVQPNPAADCVSSHSDLAGPPPQTDSNLISPAAAAAAAADVLPPSRCHSPDDLSASEEEFSLSSSPPKSPRFTSSNPAQHTPLGIRTSSRHTDAGTDQSNTPALPSLSLPPPPPPPLSSNALPGFCTPLPPTLGNTNTSKLALTPRNAWSTFLMTSTPAPLLRAADSSCLFTPIPDDNNSMSPITRSTQRMPKFMQETMMTPRSRKPVIALSGTNLCQLGNFSTWDGTVGSLSSSDSIGDAEGKDDVCNTHASGHISKITEPIGGFKLDPKLSTIGENSPRECEANNQNESDGSNSEYCSADSLTSTFRSYLCSRSVLTASPVDLSFSSRAGDFDTGVSSCSDKVPSEGGLSESLLYCLDGNEPSFDTTGIGNDDSKCSTSIDVGVPTRKRSADSSLLNNNKHVDLYDQRIESKKCHIDKILSASALMPESKHKNRVHETSL